MRERREGSRATPSGRGDVDRRDGKGGLLRFGMIEAVAQAVDDLLDREQRDEHAAERDRRVERRNRRVRGQTKAAKSAKEIEIAEIYEAAGRRQNHKARDDLDDNTSLAVHRLGERGQVEMIVSSRRRR